MAACGGGGGSKPRAAVTSVQPATTTVPPTTEAPTAPPQPTTTVAPGISGAGALLTPPSAPTVKPVGADAAGATYCRSLVDAGFYGSCHLLTAPPGTVAYLVEQAEGSGPSREVRALVWRRQGGDWSLALRWVGQIDASRDRQPALRALDLAQDGDPKVVAIFYDPGSGDGYGAGTVMAVDVVEATGTVVLHRSLDHGVARQATGGGLETWSRIGGSGSSRFTHQVIRYRGGAWRAETSEEVGADAVPRSPDTNF